MSNQKHVHLKQEINASIISLSGYGSYSYNNNDSHSHSNSSSTGCVLTKMPIVDKDNDDHRPTNQYVLNVAFYSFLGFTLLQTSFAIKAKSQAMLADSEAMFVDAGTYLFNMLAEWLKRRAFSEAELQMTTEERHFTRRLHRLYLELVPPFVSVATLLAVTVTTLRDAIATMLAVKSESASNNDPDLQIMLLFSGLNLLLDIVNVTCFARADQAVLTPLNFQEMDHTHETSPLIGTETATETETNTAPDFDEVSEESSLINLNMCSAWTHVFADTLRSVAVLVAAGIASMSDMISAEAADSVAAVIVSLIILFSCMPLTKGLVHTAFEIRHMHQHGLSALEEMAIAV